MVIMATNARSATDELHACVDEACVIGLTSRSGYLAFDECDLAARPCSRYPCRAGSRSTTEYSDAKVLGLRDDPLRPLEHVGQEDVPAVVELRRCAA